MVWSSWLQPARSAAAAVRARVARFMALAFAARGRDVKPPACISPTPAIGSSTHMPYQAGSSAQRIRIGLTGLAFAFLLVLLGSIISKTSRDSAAGGTT